MQNKKSNKIQFIHGAISMEEFVLLNKNHITDKESGAYSVFMGQVRNDIINNSVVCAIEYSCHETMANDAFMKIVNEASEKFNLNAVHILHSIGLVKAGEICLLVQVSSGHRKDSIPACEYIVERLKKEVPIWGKEILTNAPHVWKINK
jgi:molybdopterin synthase catalytic subunit